MAEPGLAEPGLAPQPITHRRVLRIALPVVLSNATVPLLGLVDIGVIGQLGAAAPQAAVILGATVLTMAYWVFSFLRLGTVGLVGQALGAGDTVEAASVLSRALIIALGGGVLLIVLQGPVIAGALAMSSGSDAALSLARTYMTIRIWTAPLAIAGFALEAWLVAAERTRAMLAVQVLKNGTNMALDLAFVLGLGWGVAGVAGATVIAEILGAAYGLWLCRAAFAGPGWRDWQRVFGRARLWRFVVLNTDITIRSALLMAMLSSVTFIGTRFGDATVAANGVLSQFLHVTAYAMDGFAVACETLVARAMGRRDPARLRQSAKIAGLWGAVTCAVMAMAFAGLGPWLIDAMSRAPKVRAAAAVYLPWMVAAPLVGWAAWMLDGIFVGATRSRDMRNMMVLSALIYVVALAVCLPLWGNHGLWAAVLVSFAARGVTLAWRYPALERAAKMPE